MSVHAVFTFDVTYLRLCEVAADVEFVSIIVCIVWLSYNLPFCV